MITTVYFDFESGGLEPHHPNIQLAAVAVGSAWEELSTFNRKIQFDESLADPEALKMNHYDRAVWEKEAEPVGIVIAEFTRFLNEYKSLQMVSKRTGAPYSVARLAGFNAATFDGPRLHQMFKFTFLPAHPIPLCVLQRALWWFHEKTEQPENYKLGTLAKYFGIDTPDAHDALGDVRTTVALAKAMQTGASQL
jgi:DNA polymerase III epsilon subunit-like protein